MVAARHAILLRASFVVIPYDRLDGIYFKDFRRGIYSTFKWFLEKLNSYEFRLDLSTG